MHFEKTTDCISMVKKDPNTLNWQIITGLKCVSSSKAVTKVNEIISACKS